MTEESDAIKALVRVINIKLQNIMTLTNQFWFLGTEGNKEYFLCFYRITRNKKHDIDIIKNYSIAVPLDMIIEPIVERSFEAETVFARLKKVNNYLDELYRQKESETTNTLFG